MASAAGAEILDDKSQICIPFILERLQSHLQSGSTRPFIIGLNGVQGVGKTTLVSRLAEALRQDEGLETLVCSIDDFYLAHDDQVALAESMPDNALVQVRGEPGTHDMNLAKDFFAAILSGSPTRVPQYDKSLFSGQGDRLPRSSWPEVNAPGQPKVQVAIFEGWCVGFRSLSPTEVGVKYNGPSRTLKSHDPMHLQFINAKLGAYDGITNLFDAFIHIDAENIEYVYDWRLEQEVMLRAQRGTGMSNEQVIRFVDAYYPAYELFTDKLRSGVFADKLRCQLRLVVGKDRRVMETIII
ncbi:putative Uridine/cytidine kinase [Xylaria bambusicola]|uniref:putative Uridine/cytidine kinase n=1 Tax=Xylaria bambusicola TaxID=326684 RepID=UPI0020081A85|nr:putative Uridine/cytidine kinase [Xylaria bambusicola]KAI0525741.1 putative Uridine/cytidine kinase [Xylaria bambusicola]